MRYKSTELRAERAGLVEEMRAVTAKDEVTSEDVQTLDRLEARFEELTKDVERAERIEGYTALDFKPAEDVESRSVQTAAVGDADEEYRDAFASFLRTGEVRADLQIATNSEGGFLVPQTWASQITESLTQFSPVRALATVIQTDTGSVINYPVVATPGTAALRAEEAAYAGTSPDFGTKPLSAYSYAQMVKVSKELLTDSAYDLEAFLAQHGGRAIARAQGVHFATGNGSTQPEGVFTAAVGKSVASTVTADALIDLFFSVSGAYRSNASWVMNDLTAAVVRKLKDSNNQYLWAPGLGANPDTILGRPVYSDPHAPTIATSAKVVVFGDFKSGVVVRDVAVPTVQVLRERFAEVGQVGFLIDLRSDAKIVDPNAIRTLQTT